jgi:SAM-dependent methyltransferase
MEETFDIIVMTEVLEHLRCPSIALENVWKLLKNNGFLIISTPNQGTIGKIIRNLLKRDFFEGLHLNCYDFSQLQYTLKLHGFKTIKLYSCEEIDIPLINRISFLKPVSLFAGKRLPTLSKQLILKARKTKPLNLSNAILSDWKHE